MIRDWYDGFRLAVSEESYRLLEQGANRRFVHPMELALVRLDRQIIGLPEDCGDRMFRRPCCIDKEAPTIIYRRNS